MLTGGITAFAPLDSRQTLKGRTNHHPEQSQRRATNGGYFVWCGPQSCHPFVSNAKINLSEARALR
jgi:hypothetical protein